jgi:hypothetical protein
MDDPLAEHSEKRIRVKSLDLLMWQAAHGGHPLQVIS